MDCANCVHCSGVTAQQGQDESYNKMNYIVFYCALNPKWERFEVRHTDDTKKTGHWCSNFKPITEPVKLKPANVNEDVANFRCQHCHRTTEFNTIYGKTLPEIKNLIWPEDKK